MPVRMHGAVELTLALLEPQRVDREGGCETQSFEGICHPYQRRAAAVPAAAISRSKSSFALGDSRRIVGLRQRPAAAKINDAKASGPSGHDHLTVNEWPQPQRLAS